MRRSPHSYKLILLLGGLLAGWGLARLVPLVATVWSPFQALRSMFGALVPIWLWGSALLLAGILIAFWAVRSVALTNGPVSKLLQEEPQTPKPEGTPNSQQTPPQNPSMADAQGDPIIHPNKVGSNGRHSSSAAYNSTESIADHYTNGSDQFSAPNGKNGKDLNLPTPRDSSIPLTEKKSKHIAKQNFQSYKEQFKVRVADGSKSNGPKIVAIGGGTGMPQLLRGLRSYTDNITAIVTVADDGGSSGRLRYMGVLPPGDFRNNIAALSESEDLITRLFQYRFAQGQTNTPERRNTGRADGESSSERTRGESTAGEGTGRENTSSDKTGLAGHNFGNLFIATMAAVTGSFEDGLMASSQVLAVRGRVLPSTLEHVTLCAEVSRPVPKSTNAPSSEQHQEEWVLVKGESKIPEAGGTIQRVFLDPQAPPAYPEAIRAILQADLILAGPGSFFTSILPNLLVPSVRDAIIASSAPSIYLCNIATQPGETDNYTVSDHMRQLQLHARGAFPNVLANTVYDTEQTAISTAQTPNQPDSNRPQPDYQWVTLPGEDRESGYVSDNIDGYPIEYRLFAADLVDEQSPSRHDASKLARETMNIFQLLKAEADERN